MLRRLLPLFAVLLSLAPSMASAAPRYLVYVQHFPYIGTDPAPDTACPMGAEGRFLPGAYRAQIVFFPSDEQRERIVEGRTLGERLPRPWGALGLTWATEGAGIGWLGSLSYQGSDDRSPAEVKPALAPPLWMAPTQKGAPPPLPPLLEAIFRPLLPQGSSADLLKLFCGTEHRSTVGDGQLLRIHRILAHPAPDADGFAAVREFLLPGQAAPDVDSWKALLDKAASASPAAFVFADYLGDKVWSRQQYLYGRFVEGVRKWAATAGPGREPAVERQEAMVRNSVTGNIRPQSPNEVQLSASWIPGASAVGTVVLSISCVGIVALLILRRNRGRPAGTREHPPVAWEETLGEVRAEISSAVSPLHTSINDLKRHILQDAERESAVIELRSRVEALEANLEMRDKLLQDIWRKASEGQAMLEERFAAAERRLAEPPQPEPSPAPAKDMLPALTAELDLSEDARLRLETAPSWEEFARRLVAEALPPRTPPEVLARIDVRLAELSGQSIRLMVAGPGVRPNPEEVERVTETRIERGVPGQVIALLRPGLRVNGRVVRRAEVEVGV